MSSVFTSRLWYELHLRGRSPYSVLSSRMFLKEGNLLNFENERDSLAKHVEKQKQNINSFESQLKKLKEENEELIQKLEKEKIVGNPFLEMFLKRPLSLQNLSNHAHGSNDDRSHRSFKSSRFAERIKMISSRSVRSDPHIIGFPFRLPSRRNQDLEGRMVAIDETGNKP